MSISFGANLINKVNVLCLNPTQDKYSPKEVSFVELNPNCSKDLKTLKKISKKWVQDGFSSYIYNDAKNKLPNRSFFALTSQSLDFDNPKPDLVLGLVEVSKPELRHSHIEYIQTNPNPPFVTNLPLFDKVGSAILTSLKRLLFNHRITVDSLFEISEFYEKNEFRLSDDFSSMFYWQA